MTKFVLPIRSLSSNPTTRNHIQRVVSYNWSGTRRGPSFSHDLERGFSAPQITFEGSYHCTETIPNAVHLFQFPSSEESFNPCLRSVLIHSQPVLHCRWNPIRSGSLVICCGSRGIYTWNDEWQGPSGEPEEVAECIGVPASEFIVRYAPLHLLTLLQEQFDTRDVRWAPDGKGLILFDKEKFCCAFEVEEEVTQ